LGITAGFQVSLLPESLPLADMYAMPGKRLTKALREDPTHVLTPNPEKDYYFTAGKLIISAPDLAKLLIVLCDGGVYRDTRILKESTVVEICTPQNNRGSVRCDSGRGLYLNMIVNDQVEGRTMLGHGGKANGMLCAAYFDPTDRTGVVMLTNGCNNRKVYNDVGMLGRAVMRICYGELLDPTHVPEDPFLVD
jgi:CubicO group peptidase (beta-lactamase class C family)